MGGRALLLVAIGLLAIGVFYYSFDLRGIPFINETIAGYLRRWGALVAFGLSLLMSLVTLVVAEKRGFFPVFSVFVVGTLDVLSLIGMVGRW